MYEPVYQCGLLNNSVTAKAYSWPFSWYGSPDNIPAPAKRNCLVDVCKRAAWVWNLLVSQHGFLV